MNSQAGRLDDAPTIREYMAGGKAILTLESLRTNERRTFRVRRSDREGFYFVDLLIGPNNSDDYRYLGGTWIEAGFPHSGSLNRKGWGKDAWMVWEWFLRQLRSSKIHPELAVWHEGRCSMCSRRLTDPESIARGIGPVCYDRLH